MNEIAESTSYAALATVQPAARLSEVGDRREFAVYGARSIPARVQLVAGFLCGVFVFKPRIDVSNKMIIIVIANYHLLYLSKLAHLAPEVLIERVEVVL